ncbi:MAG: hypothetical protein M5U28_34875 [Sandaracinaceae bacterium]|nr:hypothetical protein [Sandaracinaceae bacterium]
MIDYENGNWAAILVRIRGSVIPRLAPRVLIAAGIGAAAAWVHEVHSYALSPIAHTMIGVALGLLLVFRTNASYDRYWEGRKLLGMMVNRGRDLARQATIFLAAEEERAHVRRLIQAWYQVVVQTLRSAPDLSALAELLTPEEREALEPLTHRAPALAGWIGARLVAQAQSGALSEQRLVAMDANLTALTDALGGCERIRRTPIPFAYAQHIKIFVVVFCFTAPFAMADAMRWYTPLVAGLLAFALFGIDEIGVEIEDPFGTDPNDLPLEAIGATVAKSIEDIAASPPDAREEQLSRADAA